MFRRLFVLLLLLFALNGCVLPSAAVQKDTDLTIEEIDRTLTREIDHQEDLLSGLHEDEAEALHNLTDMERRLYNLRFAVYYQDSSNFFFLAYYCEEIAELCMEYSEGDQPFVRLEAQLSIAIQRFSHMRQMLQRLREHLENPDDRTYRYAGETQASDAEVFALIDRNTARCSELENQYREFYNQLEKHAERYRRLGTVIHQLDAYANGESVDAYTRQKEAKLSAAMNRAVSDVPQVKKEATPNSEADMEEAMRHATAKAIGTDCDVNDPSDLSIENDLTTPGRLAARITMILWDPDSPFRAINLPRNTLARRLATMSDAFYHSYIDPVNPSMALHLLGYYGTLALAALLGYLLLRRRKGERVQPRRRLQQGAKLSVALAVISWVYHLYESIGFLEDGYVFFSSFLLLTGFFCAAACTALSSRIAQRSVEALYPLVLLNAALVSYSVAMCPTIIVSETMPLLFLVAAFFSIRLTLRSLRISSATLRSLLILNCVILIIGFITSLIGYTYITLIGMLCWYIVVINVLCLLSEVRLTRLASGCLCRQPALRKHSILVKGWVSLIIRDLLTPIITLCVLWFGMYWAADGMDLSHFIRSWMSQTTDCMHFIRAFSVNHLLCIITTGVVLRFFLRLIRLCITGGKRVAVGLVGSLYALGCIVSWGLFGILALSLVNADYNSLLVVVGGMSVGVGLGLKDTLQDFASGLTLMLGRLRPGDIILSEGLLGRVSHIGLRATLLETFDGSVICYQNTSLLSKNFSNLTRNHLFVRQNINIGIPYGTDPDLARRVALKALRGLRLLSPKHESLVWLSGFGDSAVQLTVAVWVPAAMIPHTLSAVRETIYAAFRKQHIDIPFPQLDLHVIPEPTAAAPAASEKS